MVGFFPFFDKWQEDFATHVLIFFFLHLGPSSFTLLQFGLLLSIYGLSNSFRTNYYCMKFDNLYYCSPKFKMNKINK